MDVLINTKNEQEEKVLLAFLYSLDYNYQADSKNKLDTSFINQYNVEINLADQEIEAGEFLTEDELNVFFQKRRKNLL